ncbi:PKD domain-containing protein, partial [Crocinitomix algicola]|uniref:PKD domain-containing protein n=1 Tax=Crocinitomix algicola TaxID=1740263 RepID=UPI001112D49C
PNAHIEFIAGGSSSEDGSTGGCILNPVQFNDLSTIESGSIVDWSWNFGDGEVSVEENPEHLFAAVGTYTVTLTVTSEFGCTATTTIDITMDNGLGIDLIVNEPSCYGFSDGSITINVDEIVGDAIFIIKDATGELKNIDNSNTANSLSSGWYYFSVEDESDCAA